MTDSEDSNERVIAKRFIELNKNNSIMVKKYLDNEVHVSLMRMTDDYGWVKLRDIHFPKNIAKFTAEMIIEVCGD